jgi:hypothetical protein
MEIHAWETDQVEFAFPAQTVVFGQEGDYELQVFVDDAVLARRKLTVRKAQSSPRGKAEISPRVEPRRVPAAR